MTGTAAPAAETPQTIWFAHWLRSIAVVLVVIAHLVVSLWAPASSMWRLTHVEPPPPGSTPFWSALLDNDWHAVHSVYPEIAVGFFFLVSGLVIPMTLENKSVGRFLVARAFRVMPVWVLSIGLVALVFLAGARLDGIPVATPLDTWIANLTLSPHLKVPIVNPPGWTLLVEVKFYLLCALAAATIGVRRALPIALFAVVGAVAAVSVWNETFGMWAYEHGRLWEITQALSWDMQHLGMILIGMCFYNLLRSGWSVPKFVLTAGTCSLSVTACAYYIRDGNPFVAERFLGYVLAGVLFLLAYAYRHRFPESRVIGRLADWSYPIYAIHFVVGAALIGLLTQLTGWASLSTVGGIAIVVALSAVIHHYIEAPGIKLGKTLRLPLRRTPATTPGKTDQPARDVG